MADQTDALIDPGRAVRPKAAQLQTAARKLYVLDTNVLLHDPHALHAFNEHHIVVPMTVLEELDHIKDRRDKFLNMGGKGLAA